MSSNRMRRVKLVSAEEKIVVSKTFSTEDSSDSDTISVRKFATEPAYVRASAGVTKNMGNYESLRIDVAYTVPCYAEEMDSVFSVVAEKVAVLLGEEIEKYEGADE